MDNSSHLILYRRTTFSHFLAAKINLLKIEQNGARPHLETSNGKKRRANN